MWKNITSQAVRVAVYVVGLDGGLISANDTSREWLRLGPDDPLPTGEETAKRLGIDFADYRRVYMHAWNVSAQRLELRDTHDGAWLVLQSPETHDGVPAVRHYAMRIEDIAVATETYMQKKTAP